MSEFQDRLNKISLRNRNKKHEKGQWWPIEKKIEVVSHWLVIGNLRMVAATTGISYGLIKQWRMQPWWKELEEEIRTTQNIEMDTKLSKIVDKSLDAVLDRIENGDFIYDQKSGEIRRKPAALRDIHRVSVDMLSKRELLREKKEETTSQTPVEEQIKQLASEFAKFVNKKKTDVIDLVESEEGVFTTPEGETDALYEEREEGLQEGECTVQLSPGECEETGGEESGETGTNESGDGS